MDGFEIFTLHHKSADACIAAQRHGHIAHHVFHEFRVFISLLGDEFFVGALEQAVELAAQADTERRVEEGGEKGEGRGDHAEQWRAEDEADARAMLQALSGRTHRVLSAVALHDGQRVHAALNVSHVHFAPLGAAVIDAYVAGGEPFGKAGAYAIQGAIAAWIARIDGSHSGIMGLPLCESLAQAMGASLQLAPGNGRGAAFVLRLPAATSKP